MRRGLRFKLTLSVVLLLLAVLLFVFFANSFLLERTYLRQKQTLLVSTFQSANAVSDNNESAYQTALEQAYASKNIAVLVINASLQTVFSSQRGMDANRQNPTPRKPYDDWRFEAEMRVTDRDRVIESGKNYKLYEQRDMRLGTTFLLLLGGLDNGNFVYLRTPMTAVQEAADTSNRMLIYCALIALLLGVLFAALMSRMFTRPILELNSLAKGMAKLDFSRRYHRKGKDEIHDLGMSINAMSDALKRTIDELRETNERLAQENELKSKIDSQRKEFIANASHELKTPVALIGGYAEGLRDGVAADEAAREMYCDVILDEAHKMDAMIKQLLSMMENEQTETLNLSCFNLCDTVRRSIRNCGMLLREAQLSVAFEPAKEYMVTADEEKIAQTVTNYLTNAIHHVDEHGQIAITITQADGKTRLGVYNSGAQIPQEEQAKIWESFYKIDKARTRAYGGSGLGLSIVRKLIAMHGGESGVENHSDGVEFYFVI